MNYAAKVIGILLLGLAVLVGVGFLLFNYFFMGMSRLPEGELLTTTLSPNEQYSVNVYISKSGATVADAVRGELVNHNKKDKVKNIYWQYRESEAEVIWINDHVVSINGIELDVRHDVFDYRRES